MFQKSNSEISSSSSAKEASHGIDDTGLDATVTGNMYSTPDDDFKSFLLQAKKEVQMRIKGDTSSLPKARGVKRKPNESLGEGISISSDVVITNSSIKVQPEKDRANHKAKHDHPHIRETQFIGEQATKIFAGTSSESLLVSSCEEKLEGVVQGVEAISPEKAYSLIVAYGLRVSQFGKSAQEEFIKTRDELIEVKDNLKAEKEKMDFTIEYL
ncbi:uncharacterized protein LOC131597864 [Vicia villosa]|uniref:uncharacterized protein LOC131597864 n=1 Tax=Vicia villosa TaxID=3911 RepID=UPI00273B2171|nr:uncharacterized protein LOC131597864 [Vicia villosa]